LLFTFSEDSVSLAEVGRECPAKVAKSPPNNLAVEDPPSKASDITTRHPEAPAKGAESYPTEAGQFDQLYAELDITNSQLVSIENQFSMSATPKPTPSFNVSCTNYFDRHFFIKYRENKILITKIPTLI
jgi:hypothetical protein